MIIGGQAAGPLRLAPSELSTAAMHAALLGGAGLCSPALPCVHPFAGMVPCCQSARLALRPCPGVHADLVDCDCMLTQRRLHWAAAMPFLWPWY